MTLRIMQCIILYWIIFTTGPGKGQPGRRSYTRWECNPTKEPGLELHENECKSWCCVIESAVSDPDEKREWYSWTVKVGKVVYLVYYGLGHKVNGWCSEVDGFSLKEYESREGLFEVCTSFRAYTMLHSLALSCPISLSLSRAHAHPLPHCR